MINQEFQTRVLMSLENLRTNVSTLTGNVSELKEGISELKRNVSGLTEDIFGLKGGFSELKRDASGLKGNRVSLTDKVTTREVYMEDQFKEQKIFAEKLAVVIENQIGDRISAENDSFKGYTDKSISRHEKRFQHKAIA